MVSVLVFHEVISYSRGAFAEFGTFCGLIA